MLRFLRLPLPLLAAVAALGFLAPLTASAAPPPSAVKVAKSRPVLISESLSSSVAVRKTSLFDRVRWSLVHPQPKRFINGRCVLINQRVLVPFPVR
jgi:hypothetical protein